MNCLEFQFCGETLLALGKGALFWPSESLLVVSDLHFGKSARVARFGGAQLPPYETRETVARLASDLASTGAKRVICLGDSFDAAPMQHTLPDADRLSLVALQAGREWIWIEGNHDPGPVSLGGAHMSGVSLGPLHFSHIAAASHTRGEVSGHYHPKITVDLRGRRLTRPCFLFDQTRLLLPAYGAFTGGLACTDPAITRLFPAGAEAILTGQRPARLPLPGVAA
ncbi:ligase-associated DNA damage response endonuclease PdeM [Marivita sp. GX14005]|uniref:ligase-associated DNA damage response endonuclease PdeM n=1 Tax=Marivita sp. GX14005 TaxID=2942276 RepID=UPI0020195B64|nr:ligase-associated DNA damage response endonuclease PdeM [Marivita sp. GX14005]MCL3880833.1 ligase-associated DNA damage response endonuclease PdeM [Marivita sp. GX14005]